MKITAIVATRNRSEDLERLLVSLHRAVIPPRTSLEIIVVDNGSTDATRKTAERFRSTEAVAQRYLNQPIQGKALALNQGVHAATGDVLAFVDDDVIVDERWVERIDGAFAARPAMAGLGGRVELFDQHDEAVTVRTAKEPSLLASSSFTPLNPPILGCNMAFRADVFGRVGLFDPDLGPGSRIGSGDDLDFVYRALREGLEIRYLPDVLVYHNHGRSTPAQVLALQRRYVKGRGAFYYKAWRGGDERARRWAAWEAGGRVLSVIRQLLRPAEMRRNWLFLMDLLSGALTSRRIHAEGRNS